MYIKYMLDENLSPALFFIDVGVLRKGIYEYI